MNRKLQHSMTALTASAAVFGLLLLAGGPPQPMAPVAPSVIFVSADSSPLPVDEAADTEADTAASGHQRRARAALALPYFSFAQGLRRVTGS
jgi:hypothetical protein